MTKASELLDVLSTLGKQDLLQVKATVEHLLKHQGLVEKESSDQEDVELFYKALAQAVSQASNIRPGPWQQFKRTRGYPVFQKNWEVVEQFVEDNFPGIKKVQRYSLYVITTQLVVDHLDMLGVIVTIKTVSANASKIPSLFGKAFPGYIRAGLFHVLLDSMGGSMDYDLARRKP
ncbi:hypothetical protein LCGC14_0231450 [marine sediment metagenome]|uniref:Uncharacterized protein n=1 Tax=marine sediment metagenome TaxID=412755 RepID=A0A0F9XE35_9ZZZZ